MRCFKTPLSTCANQKMQSHKYWRKLLGRQGTSLTSTNRLVVVRVWSTWFLKTGRQTQPIWTSCGQETTTLEKRERWGRLSFNRLSTAGVRWLHGLSLQIASFQDVEWTSSVSLMQQWLAASLETTTGWLEQSHSRLLNSVSLTPLKNQFTTSPSPLFQNQIKFASNRKCSNALTITLRSGLNVANRKLKLSLDLLASAMNLGSTARMTGSILWMRCFQTPWSTCAESRRQLHKYLRKLLGRQGTSLKCTSLEMEARVWFTWFRKTGK